VRNELRIVGGTWRGRKLRFPDIPELRPTPDRVRETLFNWLRQDIQGLRCLDLYAGSGALGFEAASRGALRVVMVERAPLACAALTRNRELLSAGRVEIVRAEVERYLDGPAEAFDIAFLDPPFRRDAVVPCCRALEARGWLAERARVYVESERAAVLEGLPEGWRVLRDKQAGEVGYHLYERDALALSR
jgi:16S rRNA (guanine966-N2)-methyltransferase